MNRIAETLTSLHNGLAIPRLGYRADKDHREEIYDNIINAVQAGFRHFDLPADAESESLAGKALKDCGVPRYELFLTMKLGNDDRGYKQTLNAFSQSLERIGTKYADLYLINWPNPAKYRKEYEKISAETWKALETLYKEGKARAIGLANCEPRHIEHYLEVADISAMANQIRMYPGFPSFANYNCADDHGIATIGFLPPFHEEILNCRELQIFAGKYQASAREICIRYLIQKDCIALCQGKDLQELKHIEHVFDFTLSDEEMKYLDAMKNYGPEDINPDTCDF